MTGEPPPPTPPPAVPPPPGPGASRHEWHEWRRQQRDQVRSQWPGGGWYGPWPWMWGGSRPWGWFWGGALVVIGLYYLLSNLGLLNWLRGDVLWPVLLILLGVALLVQRGRGGWS